VPAKLSTTVSKVSQLKNKENAFLILKFHEFMEEHGTSERHQNNNLKAILAFSNFLESKVLSQIDSSDEISLFLHTKIKKRDEDPDQKWITTYNDYLHRIKHFFRWLHNKDKSMLYSKMELWVTPSFLTSLRSKKTKRISPYAESEIWDKEEFLSIIKYETHVRNKAALTLMWDLNARPHEISNLMIKNIRLKEKYGEGEIPFESKTGTGPILLTTSFPYVRDWLNFHPFKNEPNAKLICNLHNGAPIKPEALHTMMNQLKLRILRMLETDEIKDNNERNILQLLISNKRFNPYCIRHSSITHDSDYLADYALKKKVRWSMNSRQGSRYIKTRMGNELKIKILEHNGIISDDMQMKKSYILNCPRCDLTNAFDNKYCSKCSYPLTPEAFDQLKQNEEQRFMDLENKLIQKMENKIQQILLKVNVENLRKEQ
jgi:integrase/recombinase XerD